MEDITKKSFPTMGILWISPSDMETVTMDNKIVKTTMMKTDRAAGFFKKENVPKEEVKTLQARKEADDGRDW